MNLIISLFFMLMPMIIWVTVVAVIVKAINGSFRRSSNTRRTTRPSADRPLPQKGLFEQKQVTRKPKNIFNRSGDDFDTYAPRGRKKDFVSGYDKKYTGKQSYRRARGMQYSHTYDGHEPWDKCLPKEKDPWDKDFYV